MEYGRRNKTAFRIQVEKGKVQDQIDALLQCVTNAFGVLCFEHIIKIIHTCTILLRQATKSADCCQ